MNPRDFPFKGKPITNVYIQILIIGLLFFITIVVGIAAPGPTVGVLCSILAFFTIRRAYRDIRKEWK